MHTWVYYAMSGNASVLLSSKAWSGSPLPVPYSLLPLSFPRILSCWFEMDMHTPDEGTTFPPSSLPAFSWSLIILVHVSCCCPKGCHLLQLPETLAG